AGASPADWIVQAVVPPRRRWLPGPGDARPGYVNWGVYLTEGEVSGLCPRLQPTPLTQEGTTWWAPPIVRRERRARPVVREPGRAAMRGAGPGSAWRGIADRLALAGYTNVWTDGLANFTLAAVELSPPDWDELSHATLVLGQAGGRALAHLTARPELRPGLGDTEASHRAGGPSRIARGPGPAPRARPGGARGLAQHVNRHGYSG